MHARPEGALQEGVPPRRRWSPSPSSWILLPLLLLVATAALAVQTSTWKQGGPFDFGRAESVDVGIASDGSARLAPRRELLFDPAQAYIWCLGSGPDGTIYAGTGDDGQVLAIPRFGEARVLYDSIELQLLALTVGSDGAIYVGGSPDGTILRLHDGAVSTYFDTPESYVWSLVFGADGALYAATGDRGRLYRITAAGEGELYYDSGEVHLLTMVRDGEDLVVGTSPGGLVMRVAAPDSALVLYDAAAEEIKALARDDDGTLYFGTVGRRKRPVGEEHARSGNGWGNAGSNNADEPTGDGATVYRMSTDGAVQRLWRSGEELILALEPDGVGGLFVGTGSRGLLVRLDARGSATRLFETDESQVLVLARIDGGLILGTGNLGKVYRVGPDVEPEGFLTSEVYDARNVASWGKLRWEAQAMPGTAVRFQTRSGNTEVPDQTWSGWSPQLRDGLGEQILSPPARFLQWRARLVGANTLTPELESVVVAYLEMNLPPRVHAIDVATADGSLQPLEFNGGPDRVAQTLSSGVKVEFAYPRALDRPLRLDQVAWLRSTRIVSWVAEDSNDDDMLFELEIKGEDEEIWRPLADELAEQIYAFPTADMQDGRYRIKVTASDSPTNPPDSELTDALVSRSFVVDNTPPRISALRGQRQLDGGLLVTGEVIDSGSIIVSLEYSLDAGEWRQVFPVDSILDTREEAFRFTIEVEEEEEDREHAVLVRAADESGNVEVRKVVIP